MPNYTPEQVKDITEREKKGLEVLKELGLTPAAQISKVNLGNDTFGDKLIPYLADVKYTPKPEEKKDEKNPSK